MVFPNKVDPDDSLPAAASRCLSHRCPFVQQLGTRGGIPRATAHSERAQWQGGGDRAFLAAVCLTQVVLTRAKLPGLRATRTMVKLMTVRESVGAEDATKVQKTLLVSGGFVRGQIDPGSSAGK